MALLSTLVKTIVDVEGIDQTFATGVARYLREGGLISQAGRGRGAAHMTASDAAHLLIGLNVSRVAKDATEETKHFGEKKQRWSDNRTLHGLCDKGNTLHADLQKLINVFDETILRKKIDVGHAELSIEFHMPAKYTIITMKHVGQNVLNEPAEELVCSGLYGSASARLTQKPYRDRSDIVVISGRTIAAVTDALKT